MCFVMLKVMPVDIFFFPDSLIPVLRNTFKTTEMDQLDKYWTVDLEVKGSNPIKCKCFKDI